MTLDAVLGRIDDTLPEALDRQMAFLRIPPSIPLANRKAIRSRVRVPDRLA